MENLKKTLEDIGLNHFESTLYLQLLHNGEQAASVVSRATKIPRSTTRGVLDRLCERGIVSKLIKRGTQFYQCKAPSALVASLKRDVVEKTRLIEEIKTTLPLLNSFYEQRNIAPKVRVFEGRDQVIEAFNLSLFDDRTKELLIFTSYEFLQNPIIRKNDDDFFIKRRVKKGIPARVLVGRTKESEKITGNCPSELRERRLLPKKFQLPGNLHVYGDCVLYFSTVNDRYLAVLVEGAMMAETLKSLFEFMWESCEPKKLRRLYTVS
ncbi:hypothetical protein IPG41_04035 [Candidatus Peregrinibacteria bacterium]|nr:MAG: hypothetical protein IPG41_04035 [Candidatus Peregrinibacteria bacterium]